MLSKSLVFELYVTTLLIQVIWNNALITRIRSRSATVLSGSHFYQLLEVPTVLEITRICQIHCVSYMTAIVMDTQLLPIA